MYMPYANNKGADEPVRIRAVSLTNAFVVRCLDGIISILDIYKILILSLVSVSEQAGLFLPGRKSPKTGCQLSPSTTKQTK